MEIKDIITIISFAITIGTFIWRTALLSAKVSQNEKDINGIGLKLKEFIDKSNTEQNEIREDINDIKVQLSSIIAKLDFIIKKESI